MFFAAKTASPRIRVIMPAEFYKGFVLKLKKRCAAGINEPRLEQWLRNQRPIPIRERQVRTGQIVLAQGGAIRGNFFICL